MPGTTTKVMTAHVPLLLANKIDELAARTERSRGWIIKQALSAWIVEEEARERMTNEALADVDAGLHAAHTDILIWAQSLDDQAESRICVGQTG